VIIAIIIMGRTAWWKKRHFKSSASAGGDDAMSPITPTNTNYVATVKVERVLSESSNSNGSSTPSPELKKLHLRTHSSDSTKGDEDLVTSTNENDPSEKTIETVKERRHVDECKLSEPSLVDDIITEKNGSDNNVESSEMHSEPEAEGNQSSLEGDGEQLVCVPDEEEAPSIERTDTEDSGVGSVDSSAAGTQGSSAQATIAVSVTTFKTDRTDYTDCTDDGILRDDEGNPVDLAEAEENMLRDDEGNIIDPKTLVTKESFLDLCCECDEYCDPGSDSAQNESEIDEDTYVRFTIEAIVSEMITHVVGNDENCNDEDYTEPLKEYCNKEASATDEADEDEDPSEAKDNVQPTLGRGSRPKRNGNASGRNRSRQVRWGKASQQQGADDTVHIMFNNKLSTLDEEASGIIDEDSVEEAEDEKSNISHKSTRSEKFIKARWDYSLQVMKCEASTAQLIDARDEIDYMIQPKLFVPDDRSVCSDEGTI